MGGIKWYEQFEDLHDDDPDSKVDANDEDTEEDEEENDLYEMDPEYDPYENKLVETEEEEDDSDGDGDMRQVNKKFVSLDMNGQNIENDDDNIKHEHETQSSLIIHDDQDDANYFLKQIGVNEVDYDAGDDDETKDEDVEYQNEINMDILQKLSLNSPKNNGNLSKLKEEDSMSEMEIDDETEDQLASLPNIPNNGMMNDKQYSISSNNSSHGGSHSRTSSSASTFDID